jgi:starch synthase
MAATECVPFAKVGGLGDVLGALPVALERLGVSMTVAIPRHRGIQLDKFGFESVPVPGEGRIWLGYEHLPYDVHRGKLPGSSVDVFLIGNDRFFDRPGVYVDPATGYDYPDQADRWIFFQRAAMEFFAHGFPEFDILHCHDHQTALMPAYLPRFYRRTPAFAQTRSVFTIHNLGYQGRFPRVVVVRAGFNDGDFYPLSPFEFYGVMNFMKVGITHADLITTVSPTYAVEIQQSAEIAYGLEGVLRERRDALAGILNGIDDQLWNPAKDPLIPAKYTKSNLAGKEADKRALLEKFELDRSHVSDWPVLAMISRIEAQKGFDLVAGILDDLLANNLYFTLLGSGNKETEHHLRSIIGRHRDRAAMRFEFDNGSAHLVEAGADIFLMPSRYEPCGLNQMYSLRYGTVPVVRQTGGLADTVHEYNPVSGEGNGFLFKDYDSQQFRAAIDRALALWPKRTKWQKLMQNGMRLDLSWKKSAGQYLEAYERLR